MGIKIAPSLLSADFGRLAEEIRAVEAAGADVIHVDVMDGRFVPNITIGPVVVKAIRAATTLPVQAHLMIVEPEKYIDDFAAAGVDMLWVHLEECVHLHRTLQQIRQAGGTRKIGAGVAVNPHTPIDGLKHVLGDLDSVLMMTVNPGFGGQAFIPGVVPKIRELAQQMSRQGVTAEIAVDGGIGPDTAGVVTEAGATSLVAGSAIFGQTDYAAAIARIRGAAKTASFG